MVLEYFSLKRGDAKQKDSVQTEVKEDDRPEGRTPMLNEEEERFIRQIAEEGTPPPLPERPASTASVHRKPLPKDAQTAIMDGADQVALPTSPPPVEEQEKKKNNRFSSYMGNLGRSASIFGKKDKSKTKEDEKAVAKKDSKKGKEKADGGEVPTIVEPAEEAERENAELNAVLDQLNLAAVNNRVFSFSKESQELMDKFKVVLKDLINGAPTAYDDLEKLLRGSEEQLNKLYEGLPSWMQSLIRQLPSKITAALGPEMMAAAAEKPSLSTSATGSSSKKKRQIPNLKDLVSVNGAIAAMLRSILNFLKLRFPAFVTGTNMLASLAVFILLFVFWYCHKRGRETRLEREAATRASAENSETDMEDSIILTPTNYYEESLKKKAVEEAQSSSSAPRSAEAPVTFHEPAVNSRVEGLPSVLDLPSPGEVPLPSSTPGEEKNVKR